MAQESLNQEIKWLEEQLEAKKHELSGDNENKAEKEIVKDVLKEASAAPQFPIATTLSDDDAQKTAHALEEKEHAEIVEELVRDALTKGLAHAIKVANSMRNPHILDDFHDTLADKYYQKLLEARKLKQ